MAQSRGWTGIRILWAVAVDILRLISSAARSRPQLAAENLFLRKQLAFYVEREVKPRRDGLAGLVEGDAPLTAALLGNIGSLEVTAGLDERQTR